MVTASTDENPQKKTYVKTTLDLRWDGPQLGAVLILSPSQAVVTIEPVSCK